MRNSVSKIHLNILPGSQKPTERNSFIQISSTDSNVSSEDKYDNAKENAEKNSASQILTETTEEIDIELKKKKTLFIWFVSKLKWSYYKWFL